VSKIIDDLTLGSREVPNKNLTMYPFVSLSADQQLLATIPGIVVSSNPEENALRICIARNKSFADIASNTKEDDERNDLRSISMRTKVLGPFKLPKGMPDIDLVLADEEGGELLVAELKWLQLPMTFNARRERDKELRKGAGQITQISDFLKANPDYLQKKGFMVKPLTDYKRITFAVVCRDYISEIGQPSKLIPYGPLREKLVSGVPLIQAIEHALSEQWLPNPSIDYVFDFDSHTCNGVTVETEVFKPLYAEELSLIEGNAQKSR
jgi:hypothetical protein